MKNDLSIASEIIGYCLYSMPSEKTGIHCSSQDGFFLTSDYLTSVLHHRLSHYNEYSLYSRIEAFLDKVKFYYSRDRVTVFDVLFWFAEHIITYRNDRFLYNYKYTDVWRDYVHRVDEEFAVTAAVAACDEKYGSRKERIRFDWSLCIEHDNQQLINILNREDGVSENHFHLRGSTPFVSMSWIALMNSVSSPEYYKRLNQIEEKRINTSVKSEISPDTSLVMMWRRAVVLRLYLYSILFGEDVEFDTYYIRESELLSDFRDEMIDELRKNISLLKNSSDMIKLADVQYIYYPHKTGILKKRWNDCTYAAFSAIMKKDSDILFPVRKIQQIIDSLRLKSGVTNYDYIGISGNCEFPRYSELLGERKLCYMCLKHARDDTFMAALVHEYFLIKNKIRNELVQINSIKGFKNFQDIQNRKDYFIYPWNERKELTMARAAVESLINGPKIFRMEMRIAPNRDYRYMRNDIKRYDKAVKAAIDNVKFVRNHTVDGQEDVPVSPDQFFYTFHFIKDNDDDNYSAENAFYKCRHYRLRKKIAGEMQGIIKLREKCPETAKRVRGIDACNDEMNCRPEVFGRVYRELLYQMPEENLRKYVKSLRATYHVAEDNYDIIDALRAIDEAVSFLGLGSGSRLGHATLLGTDPEEYYSRFGNVISMPKQNALDNMVWMYYFITENNVIFEGDNSACSFFRETAETLFNDLYYKNFDSDSFELMYSLKNNCSTVSNMKFDLKAYYESWKLRGDDPELYSSGFYEKPLFPGFRINTLTYELDTVRKKEEPVYLYHMYHYNYTVRTEGSKKFSLKLTDTAVKAVCAVQKEMQKMIQRKGICIETNPSSNLAISNIESYDRHPVTKMYDRGLANIPGEIQLNVSVNTDDKTVFSTSLSNEYALLAFFLENQTDSEGNPVYKQYMVYDWIDSIRKMGNEQSFGYQMKQDYPC